MSYFTEEDRRDSRLTRDKDTGDYYGTIAGVTGHFDSDANLIDDEEYDIGWGQTATGWQLEREQYYQECLKNACEYNPHVPSSSRYEDPTKPYKIDDTSLLAGILFAPFLAVAGGITAFKLIRKTIKEAKAKEAKQQEQIILPQKQVTMNSSASRNEYQNEVAKQKKTEIPWYLSLIDFDIRFHKFTGSNFSDYCIYKRGLRNGLGIMRFDDGVNRVGFYDDGYPCGQAIRFGADGSRLIGTDKKGWAIDGRFLRIYEKDNETYTLIEIYRNGQLEDVEMPKDNESMVRIHIDNGVVLKSEAFNYQEVYLNDGSIMYMPLKNTGLKLAIKKYPNNDRVICRWNNGVQYGYCIIEKNGKPPIARYMDNLIILKTIKLEEKDDGKVDTPWYLKRIDENIIFHKHLGIDFFDYCIYEKGLRNGVGVMYIKGDIKRTGFYEDGMLVGQSIREYPDGTKLVGIDPKGWSMTGKYLRIFKNYCTQVEYFKNGKFVKSETPNEKEKMHFVKKENGTYYYSEAFDYGEFVFLDGTITKSFLNKKGKKLIIKSFPDGRINNCQYIDNVFTGYSIVETNDNPPTCKLINESVIQKTISLEEINEL